MEPERVGGCVSGQRQDLGTCVLGCSHGNPILQWICVELSVQQAEDEVCVPRNNNISCHEKKPGSSLIPHARCWTPIRRLEQHKHTYFKSRHNHAFC